MLISRVADSSILLAADSCILVFDKADGKLLHTVHIPAIAAAAGDGTDNGSAKEGKKAGPVSEHLHVVCGQLSPDQSLFCVADSHKRLLVYETTSWTLVKQFSSERKVCLITFDHGGKNILATDRTGDVYLMPMDGTKPRLLMGHLSIILSQLITSDDKFLITADRDEKIRVSRFPNSYNIEAYCLGHEEFVSALTLLNEDTLISGSGDGTIKMWNFRTGGLVQSLDCGKDHSVKHVVKLTPDRIAVCFYSQKSVRLYRIERDGKQQTMLEQGVIDVDEEITRIESLDADSLLLTTRSPDQCLQVISVSNEGSAHQQKLDSLSKTINCCPELRDLLKQSESWSSLSASDAEELKLLKKEAYDNVEQYMARKQERQQQEQETRLSASRKRQRVLANQSPITNDQPHPHSPPKLE